MARGKISRDEKRRRQDATRELLDRRQTKGEIKRALRDQFGLSARAAENYLARAREELAAETGRSRDEHRSEAYRFYLRIARDPESSTRDRIKAQERIDKLFGLERRETDDAWGSSQRFDVAEETGKMLERVIAGIKKKERRNGAGSPAEAVDEATRTTSALECAARWPEAIARLGLPQIRTCPH